MELNCCSRLYGRGNKKCYPAGLLGKGMDSMGFRLSRAIVCLNISHLVFPMKETLNCRLGPFHVLQKSLEVFTTTQNMITLGQHLNNVV